VPLKFTPSYFLQVDEAERARSYVDFIIVMFKNPANIEGSITLLKGVRGLGPGQTFEMCSDFYNRANWNPSTIGGVVNEWEVPFRPSHKATEGGCGDFVLAGRILKRNP
jgi:hypothetical protein